MNTGNEKSRRPRLTTEAAAHGTNHESHGHCNSQSETSAWLRRRIVKRIAVAMKNGADPHNGPMVISPLGRTGAPGSRDDRTCDRCDAFVPASKPLHVVSLRVARRMMLVGALCVNCDAAEGGGPR